MCGRAAAALEAGSEDRWAAGRPAPTTGVGHALAASRCGGGAVGGVLGLECRLRLRSRLRSGLSMHPSRQPNRADQALHHGDGERANVGVHASRRLLGLRAGGRRHPRRQHHPRRSGRRRQCSPPSPLWLLALAPFRRALGGGGSARAVACAHLLHHWWKRLRPRSRPRSPPCGSVGLLRIEAGVGTLLGIPLGICLVKGLAWTCPRARPIALQASSSAPLGGCQAVRPSAGDAPRCRSGCMRSRAFSGGAGGGGGGASSSGRRTTSGVSVATPLLLAGPSRFRSSAPQEISHPASSTGMCRRTHGARGCSEGRVTRSPSASHHRVTQAAAKTREPGREVPPPSYAPHPEGNS